MAQISYRANLSAAIFPMTLARAGRSVIVQGPDQNFNRSIDSPDDSNRDAGIPQIIYGENILPTADGYQSVGYKADATSFPGGAVDRVDILARVPLAGTSSLEINLQLNAIDGYAYTNGTWSAITFSGAWLYVGGNDITTATVNGVCYLFTAGALYTVTYPGPVTITNISATVLPVGFLTDKLSMCGAYNYLIFASTDTIYWSSTTTATDFTPSLVSGAGSGRVNGTAGNMKYLRATSFGMLAFCESNVVSGVYTGNSRYPWRFTPVNNSEGAGSPNQIAGRFTDAYYFFLTNRGTIQQVNANTADTLGQEVSELFERLKYSDTFNYATNVFSVESKTGTVNNFKLSYVNNRFIIISMYKTTGANPTYKEAIVYDNYFKRYGKLNVEHTSIAEAPTTSNALHKILIINSVLGTSPSLIQDVNDPTVTMQGVMVLGKFQYVRSRQICLDEIAFEASQLSELVTPANFSAYAIPTLDGKTFQPAQQMYTVPAETTGAVQTYYSTAEGKNVSLLIKGAFDLCSVDMLFHLGGQN